MATFALIAHDKPGGLEQRLDTRAAHLAYLAAQGSLVRLAGALRDDAGAMIGSLIVLEAEDRAAVERFAAADPFAEAGVFASTEIRAWTVAVGTLA